MSVWYLPRPESEWLEANGGKQRLKDLVRAERAALPLVTTRTVWYCPHCGIKFPQPDPPLSWICGRPVATTSKIEP